MCTYQVHRWHMSRMDLEILAQNVKKTLFFTRMRLFLKTVIFISKRDVNNRDPVLETWDFGAQIESHGSSPWPQWFAHMRHTRKRDFFDFCAWCVPHVCVPRVCTYFGVRATLKYRLFLIQRTHSRLYTTKTHFCSSSWSSSTFWSSNGKFRVRPLKNKFGTFRDFGNI